MNGKVLCVLTLLVLIGTSFAFSFAGLWYLEIIPSVVAGYLILRGKVRELLGGLSFVVGLLIELLYFQPSYRLGEGSILGGLIGLPGGYAVPLLLTLVLAFLIGFFGTMLGASFSGPESFNKKKDASEARQ